MLKLLRILVVSALILGYNVEAGATEEQGEQNSNPDSEHTLSEEISASLAFTLPDASDDDNEELEENSESGHDMVTDIKKCEKIATAMEKEMSNSLKFTVPSDKIQNHYKNLINIVRDIAEKTIKNKTDAYVFIKEQGIPKIIVRNLKIKYASLTKEVLILLHNLFKTVPTTTKANIPLKTVDTLLYIFENDPNLALKAHVIDILYLWLPKRPKIQARVMIVMGLEPFYHQMPKFDVAVVNTLLDLFHIILEEHIKARNESSETKQDPERLKLYKQIGLLERLNSPHICEGITTIFKEVWSFRVKNQAVMLPVFKLMKSLKPYCLGHIKRQTKTMNLFHRLVQYIKEPERQELFERINLNITEFITIAEEYNVMPQLQAGKDEL